MSWLTQLTQTPAFNRSSAEGTLDRHSKKSGVWKIDHRLYVLDWNANWQGTGSAAKDFVKPATGGIRERKTLPTANLPIGIGYQEQLQWPKIY